MSTRRLSQYEKRKLKALAENTESPTKEERRKPSLGVRSKFKKGTDEWKKEQNERRKERYWKNIDKERERKRQYEEIHKEERRAKRKEWRKANLEKERKRDRDRKRERYAKNPEKFLERQRKYYEENRDDQLGKILTNRIKREPWLGLRRAADEYSRGHKSLGELNRLVDERVALAAKIDRENRASKRKRPRPNRRDASDSIHSQINSGLDEAED